MEAPTPMPMKAASLIGVSTTLLSPNLFHKTARHFVGAVVLGDLLADEDDVGIAFDFLGKRLVEGFAVFDEGHNSRRCRIARLQGRLR